MQTRMYRSVLFGLLGWFVFSVSFVQAQLQSGWEWDEHAYEYDMSLFLTVHQGEAQTTRWVEFEIAAFSGTECRGIAVVEQIGTTGLYYYYLRARSHMEKGDSIHFKSFDKVSGEVFDFPEKVEFEHLKQWGYPSSPYVLHAPPTTGFTIPSKDEPVRFFPDFSKSKIDICFNQEPPAGTELRIYDVRGNLIFKLMARHKEETVDMEGVPAGLYLMTVNQPAAKTCKFMLK